MSIWCSWPIVGHEDWLDEHGPRGGQVLTYAEGFSNHHPDLGGEYERPAHVGIATIAPWCIPGHDQDGDNYACTGCGEIHDHPDVGSWVRLTMFGERALSWWGADGKPTEAPIHASVVLDESAARRLAADLLEWADLHLLKPIEERP